MNELEVRATNHQYIAQNLLIQEALAPVVSRLVHHSTLTLEQGGDYLMKLTADARALQESGVPEEDVASIVANAGLHLIVGTGHTWHLDQGAKDEIYETAMASAKSAGPELAKFCFAEAVRKAYGSENMRVTIDSLKDLA